MRLRKHTIKTEFDEDDNQPTRFKLVKRQATELIILPYKSSKENFQLKKTHKRFSSQLSAHFIEPKASEHFINEGRKQISWNKLRVPFKQKQKYRKNREINQVQLLNNHLMSVQPQPIRGHKRTATEPCISLKSLRRKQEKYEKQPMNSKQFDRCCIIVDDIYNKIKLLRQLGYADAKINGWILTYCQNRRVYMRDIFMKNISKSLYTMQEEYQFEKNSRVVKNKLRYKIEKGRDTFFYIQSEELKEFCRYMQEILILKNYKKAKEVESSIIQKLSIDLVPRLQNQFFVFTKKQPVQVNNFINDLAQYEHRYGEFLSLSKINKLRFLELNQVENNLKKTFQSMLTSEINKVVKETHLNEYEE